MRRVPKNKSAKLDALVEAFLLAKANIHTRANYRSDVRALDDWFEPWTGLEDRLEIIKFVRMMERKLSPASLRERLQRIKKIYDYLQQSKYRADNPVTMDLAPRFKDRRVPKCPDLAELKRLGAVLDTRSFSGLRDTVMIHLMLFSALRVSEVSKLDINDIETHNSSIRILVKGKRGVFDYMTPWPTTQKLLRHYLKQAKITSSDYALFVSTRTPNKRLTPRGIRKRVDVYFKRAKIRSGLSCHSLRHAHASVLAHFGVPLTQIQKQMRHSDYRVTLRYFNDVPGLPLPAPKTLEAMFPLKVGE